MPTLQQLKIVNNEPRPCANNWPGGPSIRWLRDDDPDECFVEAS